jgi:5-methylcytosine-specific restriction endonuclease McrA
MLKERKRLVKKLDALCRQILLKRDVCYENLFHCISCKKLLPINEGQTGHYISRRYESLRWDLRNINLQCAHCNKWLSGNLVEYRKSLVAKYGEKEIEKLETLYKESPHYSVFDLQQLVKEYQGILTDTQIIVKTILQGENE